MRIAALSNERLDPWINWSTLGPPLLHSLAARTDGLVVAPPPLRLAHAAAWRETVQTLRAADTLFWMQGSARPELPLTIAATLCGRVRRSAYVIDAWAYAIDRIGLLAVAQRLDPCFVAFREGCEELTRRYPQGRFEWLPFGVDTDVFDTAPGERDIFAFWMGRRHEPLHQAMLRYCAERGLTYRFSRRPGEFSDPRELGRVVGRSRYFLVTPPDVDHPSRTGGYSPLVMRYLEGLSAGARLLGVLPRSGEYEDLLPREAILAVAPDGSDLAARLDADLARRDVPRIVEEARLFVRREHSWARRAEQIAAHLATGQPLEFAPPDPLGRADAPRPAGWAPTSGLPAPRPGLGSGA